MKNLKILVAITAACSALISGLQAAPITYTFNNNFPFGSGQYAFSGSITTDGTLGLLSNQNFTSAEFAIAQGSNVLFDGPAQVFFPRNVVATEDAILLPEASSVGPVNLGLISADGGPFFIRWSREPGEPDFFIPDTDISYADSPGQQLWDDNVTGLIPTDVNGNWVVASAVTSPIPEPSTYGLLFGGFTLAVVAMRRRTSKQA